MSARHPKAIASYEVVRELGSGGMGVLLLARQPALERFVVLKRLHRNLLEDRRACERFVREARTASEVHHQNVVGVYDCFLWRGERFIVQEYVDGLDLGSALSVVRALPPRIAALAALQIALGLEAIHNRGIVHRDLKPANVIAGRGGAIKIADFGIALDGRGSAAVTQVGHAVGTPAYMSPEQLRGERPDPRSDLFAFGILLYELLCGRVPFAGNEDGEEGDAKPLLQRMESGRYEGARRVDPAIPRVLAKIVDRCLRAKAGRRYQSAREISDRLEDWLGWPAPLDVEHELALFWGERSVFPETSDATQAIAPTASPKKRRRRQWAALLAALVACAAATTFAMTEFRSFAGLSW